MPPPERPKPPPECNGSWIKWCIAGLDDTPKGSSLTASEIQAYALAELEELRAELKAFKNRVPAKISKPESPIHPTCNCPDCTAGRTYAVFHVKHRPSG